MKREFCYFYIALILCMNIALIENKINNIKIVKSNKNEEKVKERNATKNVQWTPYSLAQEIDMNTGIADPNDYVEEKTQSKLEEMLKKMRVKNNANPLIIFVSEISEEFTDPKRKVKRINTFLEELTKALIRMYTIDDSNLLIVLFSVRDKQSSIYSGYQFQKYFQQREIKRILSSAEDELKEGNFNQAAENILSTISELMEQGANQYPPSILFIIFISIFLVLIYCLYKKNKRIKLSKPDKNKDKNYKHTNMTIEQVLTKFDFFNKSDKTSKELTHEYCVICLEKCNKPIEDDNKHEGDFDILKTEEVKYEHATILHCGHVMHYDCNKYWVNEHIDHCPICKWKMDENRRDKSQMTPEQKSKFYTKKFNFLKGVIEIQSLINKDLLHYELNISHGEIVWDVPSIEEDSEEEKEQEDQQEQRENKIEKGEEAIKIEVHDNKSDISFK